MPEHTQVIGNDLENSFCAGRRLQYRTTIDGAAFWKPIVPDGSGEPSGANEQQSELSFICFGHSMPRRLS